MSDLQLSLLALGAVIIAAVILFNWWQERRFMQDSMNRFDAPAGDILLDDDFRIDPDRVGGFETESIIVEERFDEAIIPEDALLEDLHPEPAKRETPEPVRTAYRPEPATTRAAPRPNPVPFEEPAFETSSPKTAMSEALPEEPPFDPAPFDEAPVADFNPDLAEEFAPAPAPAAEPESAAMAFEPAYASPYEVPPQAAAEPTVSTEALVSSMPTEVDEQIDLIGKAALPAMLDTAAFLDAVRQMPRFDKPVQWLLQDETGYWQPLAADLPSGRYPQFVAALQLADRSGPVSQGTLLAFQEQVQRLASALSARLAWHGTMDPLQYAIELDQFCIDVDVMVGFHVLQGGSGPFAGTKLRGLAESNGLRLREDGAFHFEDADGRTLYTLVSQDQRPFKPETLRTVFYRGVSFQLDVPKVSSTSDAFNRMVLFARQLESAVDGVLVDDNQRALGEIEIDKIRQQLKMIHSKMVARFILPGTASAQRLFS